jgi:hypothetical protein
LNTLWFCGLRYAESFSSENAFRRFVAFNDVLLTSELATFTFGKELNLLGIFTAAVFWIFKYIVLFWNQCNMAVALHAGLGDS